MIPPVDLNGYCAWLAEAGLDAPWSRPGPLIAQKPSRVQPQVWRWTDIEPRVRASADHVVPGVGAERRIVRLANAGVPERTSAHTISVAVQYLLPGETAPAHRHTPNALRFMLKGDGAYTIVEGQRCDMAPGDLVLTPSMTWHEHGNAGAAPVMWADGLDSPVVRYLEILKMEPRERADGAADAGPDRTIHYRWTDARREIVARAKSGIGATPHDDVLMEYRDPATGESVLPTLGCYLQLLRPGIDTRAHRQSSCAVYHVVEGRGATTIADVTYDWQPGDFFVVPPNLPHRHANRFADPAILFSMQDVPLLTALGLYHEQS
jgi:gentisate 1,2-dioxygenase